jgi:8-oxo-dGTP diphosphatase
MIDHSREVEKNSDGQADWMLVVAGALIAPDGRWLMHQRPPGKMYGGLWEFPGGKVEPYENPEQSLVRELNEELGVAILPDACQPTLFAQDGAAESRPAIVLMLYIISAWEGDPRAIEGGAIGWFAPRDALALPMPPLDRDLAQRLLRHLPENPTQARNEPS